VSFFAKDDEDDIRTILAILVAVSLNIVRQNIYNTEKTGYLHQTQKNQAYKLRDLTSLMLCLE
jgi:hypothetical protein